MQIMSVRVTKPRLPPAIEANYEAMEAERTRVGVERERALVVTQEAETEHRRAVMMVGCPVRPFAGKMAKSHSELVL